MVLLTNMFLMLYFNYKYILRGEVMETLYFIVIGIIGIILAVAPQKIAKQSVLENPSMLKLIRIIGAVVAIGSIFVIVIMINI